MKKVYQNIQELAKVWINSDFKQSNLRSGRATANYDLFYSYSTVIAKYINGKFVITSYNYSPTTRIHKIAVEKALNYSNIIYVQSDVLHRYNLFFKDNFKDAVDFELKSVHFKINRLIGLQARAKKKDYTNEIQDLYNNFKAFCELLGVECDYELPKIKEIKVA